jgi:hypothetical protein
VTSCEIQSRDQQCSPHGLIAPTPTQDIPVSAPGFGPDRYDGLDLLQVIQLLRKRLNWETDIEEIIDEKEDEPTNGTHSGKSINKALYSLQDDGVFAYAILKDLDNPTARYNPYSLVSVGAERAFNSKQMFTVTASAVTQVGLLFFCCHDLAIRLKITADRSAVKLTAH